MKTILIYIKIVYCTMFNARKNVILSHIIIEVSNGVTLDFSV